MSKINSKLCFAAIVVFLLSFAVISLPLSASVSSSTSDVSNLFPKPASRIKTGFTNTTTYEWSMFGNGPAQNFLQDGPAPSSNHVLWKHWYLGILSGGIVINGKFIQGLSYSTPGDVSAGLALRGCTLNAYDQETGEVVWSTPLDFAMLSPFSQAGQPIKIDDERFVINTQVFSISNGTRFRYDLPRSISIYVPELKVGFSSGPSTKYGVGSVVAYDFQNLTGPSKQLWVSDPIGMSVGCYGDGKLFVFNTYDQMLGALDATTGKLLWAQPQRGWVNGAMGNGISYHNGKVFCTSLSGYLWANDANTGEELWFFQSSSGGYSVGQPPPVAYGKVYWLSRDGWITAVDEETGNLVWKYTAMNPYGNATTPQEVQHASQLVIGDGKIYRIAIQRPTYEGGAGVIAGSYGVTRFVCLDANRGTLIWDAKNWFEAWGPRLADGKLFGSDYIYDRGLINEDYKMSTGIGAWTYCIGKGPTQMSLSVDKVQVKAGETVKISGTVVDLSPASAGAPAPMVPLNITYIASDGIRKPIVYLKTDKDGKFEYDWTPWEMDTLSIRADSAGNDAYEAPENAFAAIVVGQAVDQVPILQGAIVVLIIIAVAVPILVWYMRKPR